MSAAPRSVPPTEAGQTVTVSIPPAVETIPDPTAPVETDPSGNDGPATTLEPAATIVIDNAVVDAADETPVSPWWWVVGIAIAVLAGFGIAYSLRRRGSDESWARDASVACDSGRAMALTLSAQLDTADTWSLPARYVEQHQRFSAALGDLADSATDAEFIRLLSAVRTDDEHLRSVVAAVRPGTEADLARAALRPALDELATSLSALEREATIAVFGTALPSSRPSA